MATPAWPPPPLNSHQNSDVHVRIRESSQPEHFHTKRKFRIVASVNVVFYSDDGAAAQKAFRGLSIWKSELIDVSNRETLAASLRGKFLDDDGFIPFPVSPCTWTEEHYDRRRRWSPPVRLSGGEEIVRRISDFVAFADGRPGNKKLMLVEARLEITKLVAVAAAEGFASWIAWYEEQRRVRRNFAVEYVRALTRPPKEEGCCAICLEEFGSGGGGGGGVAELPCLHLFHVDCINIWLEGNCVCPLCRYKLPVDDDVV